MAGFVLNRNTISRIEKLEIFSVCFRSGETAHRARGYRRISRRMNRHGAPIKNAAFENAQRLPHVQGGRADLRQFSMCGLLRGNNCGKYVGAFCEGQICASAEREKSTVGGIQELEALGIFSFCSVDNNV